LPSGKPLPKKFGRKVQVIMKITEDFYKNLLDNLYDGVYIVEPDRRIVYWNKGAERLTGFTSTDVVGSHCWDGILMHVDKDGNNLCLTGCPLAKTIASGTAAEVEIYLHHRDGHRVPVLVRAAPVPGDNGEVIGAVEIFSDNSEKITALQLIEDLQRKAFLDPLTGLANRRYTEMHLQARYDEMLRYGWQFGIVLMDIDHFKTVNDRYGHDVGDQALKMVALTLQNSSRSSDIVGRWGGEEFIAIIGNTNSLRLRKSAERYRALVERSGLPHGGDTLHVTISAGATIAAPGETVEMAVKRADRLLYESKSAGRNRVTTE
jgi:diguanylate cyclase (GGDEF)-like protein/PAS domain S-box-containing protein